MNNKTVITVLFLLVSSNAFVVQDRLRLLDTHHRPSTRLFDTEKPDSLVGQTFNISEAKQALQMPLQSDEPPESKQPVVDFPVPYKIQTKDKGLWYDETRGAFLEACPSQRIPLATIFERTLDTAEDAVLHLRRVPYERGWVKEKDDTRALPTVVVLGSGWASHALTKIADTNKMRLIVVSPVNHFVFTPSKFSICLHGYLQYCASSTLCLTLSLFDLSVESARLGSGGDGGISFHDRGRSSLQSFD